MVFQVSTVLFPDPKKEASDVNISVRWTQLDDFILEAREEVTGRLRY